VPAGQIENVTEAPQSRNELALLKFFRRAAIRALAQVRYPIVTHPLTERSVYPLATLAKIAVNDASVTPPTSPDEIAEAVIGLCGYQSFRGVEVDVLVDSIAAGIVNYASFKTDDPESKAIAWKVYSARLAAALDQFRKAGRENAALTRFQAKINSLADSATNDVLVPIEKPGGRQPDPEALIRWRARNPVAVLQPFTERKDLVLKASLRMR
jgi:hypothetical protein